MDAFAQVTAALERAEKKGLEPASFSVRIPGEEAMAAGGARVAFAAASGEWAEHARLYRQRADAGAIVKAQPPWASQLESLPPVFDEQVRQLGTGPVEKGGNVRLGDIVMVIGFSAERAVMNAELLEKCAKAYLLATRAGGKVATIPWWVRWIAGSRLRKDQQQAAAAFARGEFPAGFSTY